MKIIECRCNHLRNYLVDAPDEFQYNSSYEIFLERQKGERHGK